MSAFTPEQEARIREIAASVVSDIIRRVLHGEANERLQLVKAACERVGLGYAEPGVDYD